MPQFEILYRHYCLTLKKPVQIAGRAPLSGKKVSMTLHPSNQGLIIFKYKKSLIPVTPQSIYMDPLAHTTILISGDVKILAVEHLLSSLYSLGINSLVIQLEGDNQIPALDSSAESFTKIILNTGYKRFLKTRKVLKIREPFKFELPATDSYVFFKPSRTLKLNVEIGFNNLIGNQQFKGIITEKSYLKEICWARTFIRSPLNGDPNKWQRIRKILPILPKNPKDSPIIIFSDTKFITELIKNDEPVRHKVLDFLGDLSLLGMDLIGEITVYKPGHHFNHNLVQFLDKQIPS